jgi:hypothetical protein
MHRMIRTVAAMVLASFAFQGTVLIAHPNATRPSKITVAKPTAPMAPKSVKAPTVKTTTTVKSVKPVKPVKSIKPTTTTTMKSTKPAAKADVKLAKTTAKVDGKLAKTTVKADAKVVKSTAKADGKLAKSTAKSDAKVSKLSSSSTSSTTLPDGTSTTPTTPTLVVSNPIADKISRNPKLAAKIEARLPTGMTLAQASTGFKNQGQFIAAANVSRNLGIDFVKLQTAMTGQTVKVDPTTHVITTTPTGVAPLSLGQSIQQLKPGVNADAAAATAQAQTSAMVQTTSTTTTTTASKTRKTHGN